MREQKFASAVPTIKKAMKRSHRQQGNNPARPVRGRQSMHAHAMRRRQAQHFSYEDFAMPNLQQISPSAGGSPVGVVVSTSAHA